MHIKMQPIPNMVLDFFRYNRGHVSTIILTQKALDIFFVFQIRAERFSHNPLFLGAGVLSKIANTGS